MAMKSIVTEFFKDVMRPEYNCNHNVYVYSVKEVTIGLNPHVKNMHTLPGMRMDLVL